MEMLIGTDQDKIGQMAADWVKQLNGNVLCAPYSVIVWAKDGKPVDLALFHTYIGSSIELHLHAPGGLTRRMLRGIYNYVFEQLKCNVMIGKPKRDNIKLLKILTRMQFKYLATIPMYYGPTRDQDAVLHYTTKDKFSRWK